jgi:hypothetical protein
MIWPTSAKSAVKWLGWGSSRGAMRSRKGCVSYIPKTYCGTAEWLTAVSRRDRAVVSRPDGCRGFPRWAAGRLVGNGGNISSARLTDGFIVQPSMGPRHRPSSFLTERRMTSGHDADPVINPSADHSEVLRLGCIVPAHFPDARLGRRQLLPQRGNFTPSGLAKIFGDDACIVWRHWPAEWLAAVSRQG